MVELYFLAADESVFWVTVVSRAANGKDLRYVLPITERRRTGGYRRYRKERFFVIDLHLNLISGSLFICNYTPDPSKDPK